MARKAAIITKNCLVCSSEFETPDTKRGRKRETCCKSCASVLAFSKQRIDAPCTLCGAITETAKSVVNGGLPVYCEDCAKARYSLVCEACGKPFMGKKYDVRTCSDECWAQIVRGKKTDVECAYCGIKFEQSTFNVYEGKRSYCSVRCRNNHHSLLNPSRYGGTWSRWLRTIKERDGHRCIKCGSRGPLQVHHFQKLTTFDDPNDAHFHENLGTFCIPCHFEVEDAGIGSLGEFRKRYSPNPLETVGGWQK